MPILVKHGHNPALFGGQGQNHAFFGPFLKYGARARARALDYGD